MTTLLDEAIARVRELPDAEQDRAADVLLSVVERGRTTSRLSDEQWAEVETLRADLAAGREHYMTDDEVAAMWRELRA